MVDVMARGSQGQNRQGLTDGLDRRTGMKG